MLRLEILTRITYSGDKLKKDWLEIILLVNEQTNLGGSIIDHDYIAWHFEIGILKNLNVKVYIHSVFYSDHDGI